VGTRGITNQYGNRPISLCDLGIPGVIEEYGQESCHLRSELHRQFNVPLFWIMKNADHCLTSFIHYSCLWQHESCCPINLVQKNATLCVKVVGEAQYSVLRVQLETTFHRCYWSVSKHGIIFGITNKFVSKAYPECGQKIIGIQVLRTAAIMLSRY